MYSENLDEDKLGIEMEVLRKILADVNITCFADIYKNIKEIGNAEKNLIPNVVVNCYPCNILHSRKIFSTRRRLKTWLRSTMTNKCFNSLGLLNVHKELTDSELDLDEAGNEFISLKEERFQYFGNFVESDFT